MPGTWLAAIGRRLTREDTFERIVSPAIADLQFEAGTVGRLRRWRHYPAIVIVLLRAALHDVRVDAGLAFAGDARGAWTWAALWFTVAFAYFTHLGLEHHPWDLAGEDIWPAALTSSVIGALFAGISLATTVAVVCLRRRGCSKRAIAAAVLSLVLATAAVRMLVRPMQMSADRTLYTRVESVLPPAPPACSPGPPLWTPCPAAPPEEARLRVWRLWLSEKQDDLEITWAGSVALVGVSVLLSALWGAGLSGGPGWSIPLRLAGLIGTWFLFGNLWRAVFTGSIGTSMLNIDNPWWHWWNMALNLAHATIWLALDRGVAGAWRTARTSALRPAAGRTGTES